MLLRTTVFIFFVFFTLLVSQPAISQTQSGITYYEYKNDTLTQSLHINYISKSEIKFDLLTANKSTHERSEISGIARSKPGQDPEYDEDEEGNAYASTEYYFKREDCSLNIRIAMEHRDKAVVKEYHCNSQHNNSCPFASLTLLKKVKH